MSTVTNRDRRGGMLLLTLLVLSALAGACLPSRSGADIAVADSVIRQRTLDWVAAEASNNADSALSFLWEDATMQPPNAPEIQGHAAILAGYQSVKFISLDLGPTNVRASGDLAAIWGPLTVVIQGPAGPITLNHKFVAGGQQRDGKWKVIENRWSDNAPPRAGG